MKLKPRSHKPNEWRARIDFHSAEIALCVKVVLQLVAAHAQPIVNGLSRQLDVFLGFQLDHDQASLARDAEQIDNSPSVRRQRGNLRIEETLVELRVDARRL